MYIRFACIVLADFSCSSSPFDHKFGGEGTEKPVRRQLMGKVFPRLLVHFSLFSPNVEISASISSLIS